jgi:excinuclease ABC A subunit
MFLASYLISSLDSVIFVFDEPTIGLHEVEKGLLLKKIRDLIHEGNTVLMVEHDPGCIAAADYVVDLGPGAGVAGGRLMYAGDAAGFAACGDSVSAKYLSGKISLPKRRGRLDGASPCSEQSLVIQHACTHNLKDITVEIPLGMMVGVAGVSGSGKSSLVSDTLVPALDGETEPDFEIEEEESEAFFSTTRVGGIEGRDQICRCTVISQKPIGRMSTSTPASYLGISDRIRQIFAGQPLAKQRGYRPGHFTVNADGACEICKGKGELLTYIGYGNVITRVCEACGGSGFDPAVLEVKYQGRSIVDVLHLTVKEADLIFGEDRKIHTMLNVLEQTGMGYITLGQSATTLSGGEAQRIKLAKELGKPVGKNILYVLDEPTTGLSLADTARLMEVLDELVERGNTVLITEHDPAMLSFCDWLIELGPGGGNEGGMVIAVGTPADLIQDPASVIGRYLKVG